MFKLTGLSAITCKARLCPIGHGCLKFSLILYLNKEEKYAVMRCHFIIRNYIQIFLEIGTIVLSLHT